MTQVLGGSVKARLPYQSIVNRPRLKLPDGVRMIIWSLVNVEVWEPTGPMPRTVLSPPMGSPLQPDVPNWAWHEYGMRVGFWRLLDAFEKRGIRPTLSINGSVCRNYPRIAGAAHAAGWEFMVHGFVQVPTHRVEDQRR